MPTSTSQGKPKAKRWIESLIKDESFRILDLGCGRGTYGRLIEKPFYGVAVDAMPYKEKYSLMNFYKEFHQFDIRETEKIVQLGNFDLAIMGDVLEHLYFEEARELLDQLEKQCQNILVAVPYKYYQWGLRNHFENHLQPDLDDKIFHERYPEFTLLIKCHSKTSGDYAYFVWRNGFTEEKRSCNSGG